MLARCRGGLLLLALQDFCELASQCGLEFVVALY